MGSRQGGAPPERGLDWPTTVPTAKVRFEPLAIARWWRGLSRRTGRGSRLCTPSERWIRRTHDRQRPMAARLGWDRSCTPATSPCRIGAVASQQTRSVCGRRADGPLQDEELVAECQVLHCESMLRLKGRAQGAEHGEKHCGEPIAGPTLTANQATQTRSMEGTAAARRRPRGRECLLKRS